MIGRRALLIVALAALAGPAPAAPLANDPVAILTAIYTRVAAGKGDEGGGFVVLDKAARTKYLSKALAALWNKAEARTPKGDAGPVDFDPITNSQDPDVKSFTVTAEKMDAAAATVAVKMTASRGARPQPADDIVRYDFVRDGGHWKIDDIRGSVDGKPWSIRGILDIALKT